MSVGGAGIEPAPFPLPRQRGERSATELPAVKKTAPTLRQTEL